MEKLLAHWKSSFRDGKLRKASQIEWQEERHGGENEENTPCGAQRGL